MKSSITVQCVYCKSRKTLTADEAAKLTDMPMCEADGGPMIAVSAKTRR